MEIIEKQVEKVKEVPMDGYYDGYGYDRRHNINGKANAGLTLGIIGASLGALSLWGRGNRGLFSTSSAEYPENANININGVGTGYSYGPTAFQAWEKGCEDKLALQESICNLGFRYQNNRFADRQQLDSELFGLYKSTRDGFDVLSSKQNRDAFNLYKSQRDSDDSIKKELSDLKTQVAINTAIRPYQDKLLQSEIDKAYTAGINYTDKKTCNVLYGEVVLPNTPIIEGYASANYCNCRRPYKK